MRGKEAVEDDYRVGMRITPADAGKSHRHSLRLLRDRDHPRRCGEKTEITDSLQMGNGSPPQMRGKVENVSPTSAIDGITPADAGKRLKRSRNIGIFENKSFTFHLVSSKQPTAACSPRALYVSVVS